MRYVIDYTRQAAWAMAFQDVTILRLDAVPATTPTSDDVLFAHLTDMDPREDSVLRNAILEGAKNGKTPRVVFYTGLPLDDSDVVAIQDLMSGFPANRVHVVRENPGYEPESLVEHFRDYSANAGPDDRTVESLLALRLLCEAWLLNAGSESRVHQCKGAGQGKDVPITIRAPMTPAEWFGPFSDELTDIVNQAGKARIQAEALLAKLASRCSTSQVTWTEFEDDVRKLRDALATQRTESET